jgi:cytoplasmic iron level regulating protein YaaA (DUF328/UPF0246 family)
MTIHLLLSPAKTLKFDQTDLDRFSQYGLTVQRPILIEQARQIMSVLKQKSQSDIALMMGISEALSKLNAQRFQEWCGVGVYPAIYAYQGDVYQGLKAESFEMKQLQIAQDKIHIISGLYGLLSPFDAIEPYRLEMSTPLQVNQTKDLYAFWGNQITQALQKQLKKGDLVLNLASEEYAQVIDFHAIEQTGIDVYHAQFLDEKNQTFKIISFYAKYARGLMSRFCVLAEGLDDLEKIKRFDLEGYVFDFTRSDLEGKSGKKRVCWVRAEANR